VERHWNRVIFSDECKVIIGDNHRVYVWRQPGEVWLPQCISPGVQVKVSDDMGVRYMEWCWYLDCSKWEYKCSTLHGDTRFRTVACYCKAFPPKQFHFPRRQCPRPSGPCSRRVEKTKPHQFDVWPAQSPDVNIIENCWLLLKNKLNSMTPHNNNVRDLEREIRHIWGNIPVMYIRNLYNIPQFQGVWLK
jgi:hypothetical protein